MKNVLVINGPNLDMLGVREPSVYGRATLADLEREVQEYGASRSVAVTCFQSNDEGELIRAIHAARDVYDGIVYNPGAHTHYAYSLRDAIGSIDVPCVEVHISDIDKREPFRRVSVIAPVCVAQIKGRGFKGYCDAIDVLMEGRTARLGEGGAFEAQRPEDASEAALDLHACTPAASAPRIAALRKAAAASGMDAFFVRDTSNIMWLTAFDDVFDDERAHALLVTSSEAVLHTDSRYSEAARAAASGERSVAVDDARMTHASFAARELAVGAKRCAASKGGSVVLGVEDSMELVDYRRLETAFVDGPVCPRMCETSDFVVGLRAVKEPQEIARMRAAQAITDAAFAHIVGYMRPGMTEREVQIELEDFMRRHGAEGLAFSSIVATGPNGASPHAIPGATVLESGQCVVLDFGARALGYCSDMTRTVFLGEPSARLRDAYSTIREANEQVEAALRPGVTGKAMHELAEQVLARRGFGGKMGHGLGHGVGIDIHEEPVLSPRNDKPLVAGNVVTVEPGIYLPGEFGMRLEDFGVVTQSGFDVFTRSPHEPVVL